MEENTDKTPEISENPEVSKPEAPSKEELQRIILEGGDLSDISQESVDKIRKEAGIYIQTETTEEQKEPETVKEEESKEPEQNVETTKSEKPKIRSKKGPPPKQGEPGHDEYVSSIASDLYERNSELNHSRQMMANQQKAFDKRMKSDPIFRRNKLKEMGIEVPEEIKALDPDAEGFDNELLYEENSLKDVHRKLNKLEQRNEELTNEVFGLKEDKKLVETTNSLWDNVKVIQNIDPTLQTEIPVEQIESQYLNASDGGKISVTAEQCGISQSDWKAYADITKAMRSIMPSVDNGIYPDCRSAFLSSIHYDPRSRFQTPSKKDDAEQQVHNIQTQIQMDKSQQVQNTNPVLTHGDSSVREEESYKNAGSVPTEALKLHKKPVHAWSQRELEIAGSSLKLLEQMDRIN